MAPEQQATPAKTRSLNPLEWSAVDRALLVLVITFGFAAGFSAIIDYYLSRPDRAFFMNNARWGVHPAALWIEPVILAVLIVPGLYLRTRSPGNVFYIYLANYAVWFNDTFWSYMIGYYTTPIGMIWLGTAFACFLFFGLKPVFYAMLSSGAVMIALAAAERYGLIPYAPMFSAPPYEDATRPHSWWVQAAGWPGLVFTMVIIWLCTFTIARWREREDKLAQAYADLRAAKDKLVRAESLAAVGSLVTGAAHELRNPLASVSSLVQSVLSDLQTGGEFGAEMRADATEALTHALKTEARARAIVDRLYRLSDDLVTQKSKASLSGFIEALQKKHPSLAIDATPEVLQTRVPEGLVQNVLPALLDNAFEAGGEKPPRLEIRVAGNALEITVSDSGCGVPAAQQSEVFKPFFTAQKGRGGTHVGLGLYIVHEIVTRLGGDVTLQSEEGKGTRVGLRLPL